MIHLSNPPPRSEGLSFLVSCLLSIVPGCVSRNAWVISVAADSCTTMTAYEAETTTAGFAFGIRASKSSCSRT